MAPDAKLPLGFMSYHLADGLQMWEGKVPRTLAWSDEMFSRFWSLHPEQYHTVKMFGKPTFTPRWQQAYGANYRYTGSINAIAPGLIDTEILSDVSQERIDAIVQSTPLGRIGSGDDVADAALFLLSEQSSFITGQTLVVCGGRVMSP